MAADLQGLGLSPAAQKPHCDLVWWQGQFPRVDVSMVEPVFLVSREDLSPRLKASCILLST